MSWQFPLRWWYTPGIFMTFFLVAKGASGQIKSCRYYQLALASLGSSKKRGKGDPNHCNQLQKKTNCVQNILIWLSGRAVKTQCYLRRQMDIQLVLK